MTKYTSLAQWAQELGSKANTKKGHRAAIRRHIAEIIPVFDRRYHGWYDSRCSRAKYHQQCWHSRAMRGACTLAASLGLPTRAEARKTLGWLPRTMSVEEWDRWSNAEEYDGFTVSEYLKIDGYSESNRGVLLGPWLVETSQEVTEDRGYYSKAWHRQYGPKRTISDREITFTRAWGKGKRVLTYNLSTWSGDFVAKAIINLGLAPKASKVPLRVRLNKAYDAKLITEKRGYKFYQRTLLGHPVDYVIVSPLGVTYHDTDRKALTRGLHAKIKNQLRQLRPDLISWKTCKKLGFCDAGIKEFCDIYGLDIKGAYTPGEIETRVRANIKAATPFLHELKTIAQAVNYKLPV